MPDFHVTWEIDIAADSAEQAARLARDYQRAPGCGVFDVVEDAMGIEPDPVRIDLDELDQAEVAAPTDRAAEAAKTPGLSDTMRRLLNSWR